MRPIRKLPIALLTLLLIVPGGGEAAPRRDGDPSARALRTRELLDRIAKPDLRLRSDRRGVEPATAPLRSIIARHLTSKDAALDPRTFARIVHDAIEASGLEVISTAGGTASTGTMVRVGLGAGDLNGDGSDDVIELRARIDPETFETVDATLIARRGGDARRMWSRPLNSFDVFVIPAGDLTGDRRADLLTLELFSVEDSGEGTCTGDALVACASASVAEYRWLLEVRSGMTGRPVWSHGFNGRAADANIDAFGPLGDVFAYGAAGAVAATNAFVLPALSDDLDGDGTRDVIVNAIDFAEVFAFGEEFSETGFALGLIDQIVTATRADVVRGRNGLRIHREATPPHPGVSFLWTPGDAVGDDTADLLWEQVVFVGPVGICAYVADQEACPFVGAVDVSATMIDGSTRERAWTQRHGSLGANGFYLSLDGDADGDGKDDITFLSFTDGATIVVSGATGQTLWSSAGFILGALGVDPVTDTPLLLSIETIFEFDEFGFDLIRLDGRTGEEVTRSEHRITTTGEWWEVFILAELWVLPDADADGVDDLFVQISVYEGPSVGIDTSFESGATTAVFFERHADREFFGIPLGDLDGDGTIDLLDLDVEFHRPSLDLGLSATALPSGTTLWATEMRFFPFVFGIIEPGGDLTRDGSDDILLSIYQETPTRIESAVRAIDGDSGATVWQLGQLSEPPLPGTASISGTITGEGSPFIGGCVNVFDTDFNYLGTEIASSSGAYVIPELEAGSYKLEFGSCAFLPFAFEWWDDEPDFDSADVITIADGETITGVDADLVAFEWE